MKMKMNYNNLPENNNEFTALPTGSYEMVIGNARERATKSGAESFQVDFIVRNDLDGVEHLAETNKKYHNRHVFMDNWKRKATNEYSSEAILQIMAAAGFPDGKEFDFPNDAIQYLYHKPVRVYVKKTTNEYNGEKQEVNQIAPWNLDRTEYKSVQHQFKKGDEPMRRDNSVANNNGGSNPFEQPVEVDDNDLPF
jgi:hypothetical protein